MWGARTGAAATQTEEPLEVRAPGFVGEPKDKLAAGRRRWRRPPAAPLPVSFDFEVLTPVTCSSKMSSAARGLKVLVEYCGR